MVAHDLGHEGKAEAAPLHLGGDEGLEEVAGEVRWYAGAVVVDAELDRQAQALLRSRHVEPDAGPERGRQDDLAVRGVDPDRLRGVLHEVQDHLDQLVPVAEDGRQGGIVVLDEADMPRKARLCEALT